MAWPVDWDRGSVLGAIEEASGHSLSADDAMVDTLIAKAQELGLSPADLKLWIYDMPEHPWTMENLEAWAARWISTGAKESPGELRRAIPPALCEGLPRCGHCGAEVQNPEEHQCP